MLILLTSLACAWYMAGLCWFVQAVAYPQFARVAVAEFAAYHKAHMTATGWVVMPVMLLELATAVGIAWRWPHLWSAWASAGLVVVIWVNTFAMAVPTHNVLSRGHDAAAIRRLVRTNVIRTIAWTVRGGLLAAMILTRYG